MLIITRDVDEKVVIGDRRTVMGKITVEEEAALRACSEPVIARIAQRLLATLGTPAVVTLVDVRGGKRARSGFEVHPSIPVHKYETYKQCVDETGAAQPGYSAQAKMAATGDARAGKARHVA